MLFFVHGWGGGGGGGRGKGGKLAVTMKLFFPQSQNSLEVHAP